jgi:hypothetical protein
VNDSDPDGDTLIITAVGTPAHGSASFTSTSVTYKPATGFSGGDSFGYTISDGRGGTASSTISVTVAPRPNHSPVAVADSASTSAPVGELADVCIAVLANDSDPDGDTLSIAGFTQASAGTVVRSGNLLCYSVYAGNITRTFTYTISDGFGGSSTATVTVKVTIER